jgi:ribonuclease P/MRP protein subunit RPP1
MYYDLCLRDTSEHMREKAEELGWDATNCEFETVFLEADDWGELKRKIGQNREEADVLVFRGGDEELNRKAAEGSRIDVLLHPEKGRKDSGVNHVIAKEAAKNNVAIGFDFRMLDTSDKTRSHILRHWSRNLMLCEKYDAPYIITTGAEEKYDLRAPRDLASIIDSLGYSGSKSVSEFPEKILERAERVKEEGFVRPGEKVRGGEE